MSLESEEKDKERIKKRKRGLTTTLHIQAGDSVFEVQASQFVLVQKVPFFEAYFEHKDSFAEKEDQKVSLQLEDVPLVEKAVRFLVDVLHSGTTLEKFMSDSPLDDDSFAFWSAVVRIGAQWQIPNVSFVEHAMDKVENLNQAMEWVCKLGLTLTPSKWKSLVHKSVDVVEQPWPLALFKTIVKSIDNPMNAATITLRWILLNGVKIEEKDEAEVVSLIDFSKLSLCYEKHILTDYLLTYPYLAKLFKQSLLRPHSNVSFSPIRLGISSSTRKYFAGGIMWKIAHTETGFRVSIDAEWMKLANPLFSTASDPPLVKIQSTDAFEPVRGRPHIGKDDFIEMDIKLDGREQPFWFR